MQLATCFLGDRVGDMVAPPAHSYLSVGPHYPWDIMEDCGFPDIFHKRCSGHCVHLKNVAGQDVPHPWFSYSVHTHAHG